MSDDAPSEDALAVLDSSVESLEALDALLFLVEDPTRWWPLTDVARAVGLDLETTRDALRSLRARGVVTDVPGASVFRLSTQAPIAQLFELKRVCAYNRTSVVNHVSRRALGRVQVLAEAYTRGRR